jgi:ferredoxin
MASSGYNPGDDHAVVSQGGQPVVVEVAVDPELCIGSADCTRVAPAAFRLDEDQGVAVVMTDGVASTQLPALIQAARGCPTQAIRVAHDGNVVHDAD